MKKITKYTLNKKNIKDFASARNSLLSAAKTKWVLFLDRDEKLSQDIKKVSDKYDGYRFRRNNFFLNQYVGSDYIVRLGKKGSGKWMREVHEYWDIKNVGMLDNEIIHNTANRLSEYIEKMNYYSDLHAKANQKEGKESSLFKIIFYPIGKFIITFIKSKHIVFSIMQALHSFLSWSKMYFRTDKN